MGGCELASLINKSNEHKRTVNVSERVADTSTGSICWINLCNARSAGNPVARRLELTCSPLYRAT